METVRLNSSQDGKDEGRLASGGGGGMASMMEEMKNKLASRRRNSEAAAEDTDLPSPAKQQPLASPLVKTRPQLGASPGLGRAASSLARLEVVSGSRGLELVRGAGDRQQLDKLKEDILREIRAEIEKSKLEIIQIIRSELQNK